MRTLIVAFAAVMFTAAAASAQDAGRALVRGDSSAAAAAVAQDLGQALARAGDRLAVADLRALEAQLAEDLSEAAALARDRRLRWSADLDIAWRRDAAPEEQGRACGGYVDIGEARVTATSTSRASAPGLARLSCTLATQSETGFGWIGFAAISPGEGALMLRFSVDSPDAAVRQAAAQPLQRALARIVAAVRSSAALRPPRSPRAPGEET
ncbi:MAG: hypothetical protein HXY28_06335 [Hydrogenophilaceae bacterium]|jgi:hypothetical protein|nr:hypothetical protein [Hydrogenophilaceae bacterium]